MDPYTVSERKEQAFWDQLWEEYEKYPPGTRFRHKDGGTIVKMANNSLHGLTENNLLCLGTGVVSYSGDRFRYPEGFSEWEILSCTGQPYRI